MGSNKGRYEERYEEKDRIKIYFEEIARYASSLGVNITDENISWDNGFYALDITHNLQIFRIENYKDGYIWLHMNTYGNGGVKCKKAKYHKEGEFKSYHALLNKLSRHHGFKKEDRQKTKKNSYSRKMDRLFEQIKNK